MKNEPKTQPVKNLLSLPRPKLTSKDYAFFSTLAEAVSVFKTHDLPGANCEGCIVSPYQKAGKRKIKFVFAVGTGRTIGVDIDIDELQKNPKEYIDLMLEMINGAYKEAKAQFDTDIFIMGGNSLQNAIAAVNGSKMVH